MTNTPATAAPAADARSQFAADVRYYLAQVPRQLPSKYLYDSLGSALFEAITHLPWYPLARAEARLLRTHAPEVFASVPRLTAVLELGPGSADKLLTLLHAGRTRPGALDVRLIDVSASALARATRALDSVSAVTVVAYENTYETGLERFRTDRRGPGRTLAMFLGSNLGNFDPPGCEALLRSLRAALCPFDVLLLGADLVKPAGDLVLAYDDPLGVTSAFNQNLLVRIKGELGGDFDVSGFTHRAVWNSDQSRVEMHLVSRRPQVIRIPAADFEFSLAEGESIWTESSYKYRAAGVPALLERNGFRTVAQWIDAADPFALTLAEAR